MAIVTPSEVMLRLGIECTADNAEHAIVVDAIADATGSIISYLRYDPEQKTHTEYYPMTDFGRQRRDRVWEVEGESAVLRDLSEPAATELQLRNIPLRGSTAPLVRVDLSAKSGTASGSFGSDTAKTEGTDFWANYDQLDSASQKVCVDGILRSVSSWPTIPGSVRVIYVAGYSAAELAGTNSVINARAIKTSVLVESVRRARIVLATLKTTAAGVLAGPLESERLGDYSYKVHAQSLKDLSIGSRDLLDETKQRLAPFINYGWSLAS